MATELLKALPDRDITFSLLYANQTPDDAGSAAAPDVPNALGKTRLSAASAPLKDGKKNAALDEEGSGTFTLIQLASALAVSASVVLPIRVPLSGPYQNASITPIRAPVSESPIRLPLSEFVCPPLWSAPINSWAC